MTSDTSWYVVVRCSSSGSVCNKRRGNSVQ